MQEQLTPEHGLCECGCGRPAPIAKQTRTAKGQVRGKPMRFIRGHVGGRQPRTDGLYRIEDRGYETPCWIWQLTQSSGYGQISRGGDKSPIGAHVRFWEDANGPVPDGLQIDHRCRVSTCVNPAHLEAVTPAENARRRPNTKLTADAVREVRRMLGDGFPRAPIAERFGVSVGTISDIKYGRIWRDIR